MVPLGFRQTQVGETSAPVPAGEAGGEGDRQEQRERERQRDRETERQGERERDRETGRQKGAETERQGETEERDAGGEGESARLCLVRGGARQGDGRGRGRERVQAGVGRAASDGTIRESTSETLRPESWTGALGRMSGQGRQRVDQASFGSGVVVGSPSTGALCKLMAQPLHPPQGLFQEARPDQL